jgi:mutator protein MutT
LSSPGRAVHVIAGALIDGAARVLIAQRPPGSHLAGGWEFPGGKLEAGEERRAGLARELHEELGVTIEAVYPLMCAQHAYRDRTILLDVWVVTRYRGEPHGLDGQELQWCTAEELAATTLLPADRPIITALRLPAQLLERATQIYRVEDFARMRGPGGDDPHPGAGGRRLLGISCSGEREALAAASAGADFLVIDRPLAAAQLQRLCDAVNVPVYARGIPLEEARSLGATGLNGLV